MAFLSPGHLESVVAIGFSSTDGGQKRFVPNATGFLYGHLVQPGQYQVYLVTARHVFTGFDAHQQTASLRFNPSGHDPAKEYDLTLRHPDDGTRMWFPHPDPEIDVAVIPINAPGLKQAGIQVTFFSGDEHVADRARATQLGVTEGDGVFVLGFPMQLVGRERNYVIVRQGSIARIRDALSGISKEFLLDIFVFPGNSGGPVVLKPEQGSVEGTKPQQKALLIGVVTTYVPYQDVAISQQTKRPRVIFEENSGLAAALPVDCIQQAVEEHTKTVKAP